MEVKVISNTLKDPSSVKLSVDYPFQRSYPLAGHTNSLPLVINNVSLQTLNSLTNWLTSNSPGLEELLTNFGAILFRGFPLKNSEDFSGFVSAFPKWIDLPYEDSLSYAVRVPVCARVCTTNEGKTGGMVFHHEQAQAPKFPSKLLFYCEQPADIGGGTAICPSDVVLKKLEEKYPDFIKSCEEHGVKYWATLPKNPEASIGAGRGWKSFFGCDTQEEVENKMKHLGYTWEWIGEKNDITSLLRTCTPILPAVITASGTSRRVFFNQLIAHWMGNAKDYQAKFQNVKTELDVNDYLMIGDGSEVNKEALEYGNTVCEETAVEVTWQKGDVLLIDNFQVMHARRAFEGPRRVLASLVQ